MEKEVFGAPSSWTGLPFIYEKVRISSDEHRIARCDNFLGIFSREGCRLVKMSCADHDKFAATISSGDVVKLYNNDS